MMEFFEINNERYACKIYQRKVKLPYLLMLHGFMGEHRVFDHLIDDLCKFCNPVTVDLLGYGQSSKPENPSRYNESSQVKDISQLVQKLNLSPVILLGYSMGGRLALKTVLSAPELFKGLILESTTCGISNKVERKERRKIDEQRAQQIEKNYEQFLSEWQKLELFQPPLPVNKELTDNYLKVQLSQSPKAISASLRGFSTGSMAPVCDQLKNIELPVLLLAGSKDQKYQTINKNLESVLPKAKFVSIKAGHRTHLDNPSAFIQEVNSYLAKI